MRSAKSAKSRKSGYSLPSSSVRSGWEGSSSHRASETMAGHHVSGSRDLGRVRDLERGPVSEPESEAEKIAMMETPETRPRWKQWRRFLLILMVVLGLAGLAVGIIFGTRAR